MSVKETQFTFASTGNVNVHVYQWSPAEPRAVVQIAHGAAEHAGRYRRLAQHLVAASFTVFANDHRGHGNTAGTDGLGYFATQDGWNLAVADLHALNNMIHDQLPGKAVALLGHSMGSLMAQQYLFEHGNTVDAAILSGSTVADAFTKVIPVLEEECKQYGRQAPSVIMAQLIEQNRDTVTSDLLQWLDENLEAARQ